MPEKKTISGTIEQKCNNKKEFSVMEHFDTDVNLAYKKPVQMVERRFFRCVDKCNNYWQNRFQYIYLIYTFLNWTRNPESCEFEFL